MFAMIKNVRAGKKTGSKAAIGNASAESGRNVAVKAPAKDTAEDAVETSTPASTTGSVQLMANKTSMGIHRLNESSKHCLIKLKYKRTKICCC